MLNNNKKYIYNSTIRSTFNSVCKKYPENILLSSSFINNKKSMREFTFKDVKKYINQNIVFFKENKIYLGDRIAVMVGNSPEYFILKLSLNYYGLSCVPINMELSINEIQYILKNSSSRYIICLKKDLNNIKSLFFKKKIKISVISLNSNNDLALEVNSGFKKKLSIKRLCSRTESSILYTSGTTGKPKGCVLTHEYEINAGYSYAIKKGLISFNKGKERLYNCLPVHHVNSGILSFFAMLITANCQIQAERFSVKNFWKDIKLSNATVFHYLGVMAALLLKNKKNKIENKNSLRIGVGAGIEPSLHKKFEKRFKVPMIELWGMTEMVRCIFDNQKSRKIGKRCFGKVTYGLETKVINKYGNEVLNSEGEFLIRFNKQKPKTGFFSMYNKNASASKAAWKNGWFITGDIVIKDKKGNHYFVDRAKNIIRRSGENISSSEIEQGLLKLNFIVNCCVMSIFHRYYEEEVFAFIVLSKEIKKSIITAKNILKEANESLAYFKLPCYIKFMNSLPLTSSQKTNRGELKKIMLSYDKNDYFNLEDFKRGLKK